MAGIVRTKACNSSNIMAASSLIPRFRSRRLSSSSRINKLRPDKNAPAHFVFGANTDVGKTVVTAGLVRASGGGGHYVKPLQCGGSDQAFVQRHAPNVASTTTLFDWDTPASPHVACRLEQKPVSDDQVVTALHECLLANNQRNPSLHTWIETAGGVLSPSSSSPENVSATHAHNDDLWGWVTQADLYQRVMDVGPVVLVGDGKLGGISATLSALESLLSRGYDVSGIVLIETGYSNQSAIREYACR
jgi:dethiobiotin synthetase/adenosylmethionine--8-amino-7-oxononanoate aminotransferase